jgi:hypothetical protein
MTTSMMERFRESGFEPVEVRGELVHPMYRVAIAEGDRIRITWMRAESARVQGLSLRLRLPGITGRRGEGGLLRVEDVEAPTIVLWMSTAPAVVDVQCVALKPGAELQISNRWRLADGREDEWLNNFGMRVEPRGRSSAVLHCSDGFGNDLTFNDLVVRVEVVTSSDGDVVDGGERSDRDV